MFDRFKLLIGDKINDIYNKTVLVIGLGGVGSYVCESLVRSGIGNIILVDFDKIDITNLNRQLMTLQSNVGLYKADVLKERINDINPDCNVKVVKEFIDSNNLESLFCSHVDYVVDACDSVSTKKDIIRYCLKNKIKFISCMGTANKLDPSKLSICDVRKTSYDSLAKIIRKMVKDEKLNGKVMVVSSCEAPIKTGSKTLGSCAFVPSVAGLLCTSYIINDIVGDCVEKD